MNSGHVENRNRLSKFGNTGHFKMYNSGDHPFCFFY